MSTNSDFRFWWFITRRCNRNCRHCLRHGIGDKGVEFGADRARQLLLDWIAYLRRHGKTSSIEFGGSNPLMRADLPDLLRICKGAADEGVFTPGIRILANPETLTPEYARMMAECGVNDFPVSIDGLEKTNDMMRGEGNFKAAVKALDILREAGIPTWVKFTCVRKTASEYAAVRELAARHGVTKVLPGRLILEGGGRECADQALSDDEWDAFLKTNGIEMQRMMRRPPMRSGVKHFVVMAGGEFRPNRRGPALGMYPDEGFEELIPKLPEKEEFPWKR